MKNGILRTWFEPVGGDVDIDACVKPWDHAVEDPFLEA